MGLIDDIRKRRDSWTARLEEHRNEREEDDVHDSNNSPETDESIIENRIRVGNYPKKEKR